MANIDLRNDSKYNFKDISSEQYREYNFDGVDVTIEDPQYLATSDHGHRILDGHGKCHYVGFDGYYFTWEVQEGEPHFVA
ncbi:hypothetical protein [Haloarcula nitratireducens]|uniref:Uncharacterized protein n=1 Tax=Haloarcula nitratireducens TaxID=2487749 RepID=A0AAW4PHU8_9EURY|nr:hypothetical protein [Halomicroarcula nitratireducens]MBX0297526.1 hypothetical protein [Halomicroarcula nitratireducens]